MKDIKSLVDMEKDIITHDEKDLNYLNEIFESNIFSNAEIEELNSALKIILNDESLTDEKKKDLLDNSWKINDKFKCPTPTEFLTEKWIGPMANDLYPHIKELFLNFFDPIINKNKLIMYSCTGYGKSTVLGLMKYYRALRTIAKRNPKQFLKLSESTRLTDISVSLNKSTAYDLVIKPMVTILETSPMCQKLRYERDMNNPQYTESGKILFCNTSQGNSIFRLGDVYFDVASDPMDLVGRNIFSASATELAFLCEVMPEERVMKITDEMITRVYNRFGPNNPNTSIIIDSSPNSMEGKIDQWIAQHKNDYDTMYINAKKWEVQPWIFPVWQKDNSKTFPMFVGTSAQPPKVLKENEIELFDVTDVMYMPIDIKELALDNPSKILRDYGAHPTSGSDEKLIHNYDIIDKCFVPNLDNIYFYNYASSKEMPEGLLWKQVKHLFVYSGKGNSYKLKRAPHAERFVHIDLAEKHDMASISMVHLECDNKGNKIYVVDFTLPILCKKDDSINISAFRELVWDLRRYGNVNLKHVSYDQFQSSESRQILERLGFELTRISVDIHPDQYLNMVSYMQQERLKIGKNLLLKNNFKSLTLTTHGHHGDKENSKLTVGHIVGEYVDMNNQDWENSKAGYFSKDCSDSLCGAIALCDMFGKLTTEYLYNYDEEKEIEKLNHKQTSEELVEELSSSLGYKL